MDELVRWLGEQLDEDEQEAQDALKRATTTRRWIGGEWVEDTVQPPEWRRSAWDPARVLREIDAKRAIVEDLAETLRWGERKGPDFQDGAEACGRTLKRLALPYADRPGYREEWAP